MVFSRLVERIKAPLRGRGKTSARPRWLVISNCQTTGLANSLSLLGPGAQVDACNLWQLKKRARHWRARLGDYDHLFLDPMVRDFGLTDLEDRPNLTSMPAVIFGGFHPDLCYIPHGKGYLKSALDDYHSLIAVTAYRQGCTVAQTLPLFRADIYRKLGYFELWNAQRAQLMADFNAVGWDLGEEFLAWVRQGVFMHSPNHPHIEVLHGMARRALLRAFGTVRESGFLPHDNLANGAAFPVYPDIAERFGMRGGSYFFKPIDAYRVMDLEAFVADCFARYARCDRDVLVPRSLLAERAPQILAEEA